MFKSDYSSLLHPEFTFYSGKVGLCSQDFETLCVHKTGNPPKILDLE